MKYWKLGNRITAGYVTVLSIMVALGVFTFIEGGAIKTRFTDVAVKEVPSLHYALDAEVLSNANLGDVYKHILSSSLDDMTKLEAEISKNAKVIADDIEAFGKLANTDEKRVALDKVKESRSRYVALRSEILAASRAATTAETSAKLAARARRELDPLAEAFVENLDTIAELSATGVESASAKTSEAIASTNQGVAAGSVLAVLIGGAMAFAVIRSLSRELHGLSGTLDDASSQVAAAAGQVSTSSQSLAEGASEQAASLEETSSSLEEITSMAKRNEENALQAKELSRQTRAAADSGSADMNEMKGAMDAIKVSSNEISKIVKTIDEIAFQTNILALNAAVEAARAGEAGSGFAVVAEEVRNLAQRCAQSAKETAGKIEDSVVKSENGVRISGKVAVSLDEIVEKASKVDTLIAEIAHASQEQTQGIGQVNGAVSQMDKVTQSNAGSAEETAAAAEELNAQAAVMKDSVHNLLVLIDGKNGQRALSGSPSQPKAIVSPIVSATKKRPAPSIVGKSAPKPKREMALSGSKVNGDHSDFFKDA